MGLRLKLSQKANLMLMLGCTTLPTDTGHHGTMATMVTILAREVPMPSQKEKLMLGCTILLMDTGQRGILDTTATTSAREVLMPNQKVNLMPMPIFTTPPTDTGHLGTLDTI